MMWYWGGGWHWWDWFVGVVVMLAFWAVVIWAIWFLVGSLLGRRDGGPRPGTPDRRVTQETGRRPATAIQILDQRLARGEIDLAQYRALRDVLEGSGPRDGPEDRRAPEPKPEARVGGKPEARVGGKPEARVGGE